MENTQQVPLQTQPQPQVVTQPQAQQQQHYTQPASTGPQLPIVAAPAWVVIVRGFQFFFAILILGLSGAIIHWVYMDELGLALAISLFTWIIVLYTVLSEKLPSLRKLYHIYAVLALDLFLVILWLATMGANASRRALFTVSVNASCSSDGSAVNSGRCTIFKRYIVMSRGALAMFAAVAGLSALQFVLFLATFIWTLLQFLKWRKTTAPAAAVAASQGEIQMETKQPFLAQQTAYPPQQQPQQQQQQQAYYPPQSYTPQPQGLPQQFQPPPQPFQEISGQQQQQQQQQQFPQQTPPTGQGYVQQQQPEFQQQYPPQQYAPSAVNPVSPTNSPPPQGHGHAYPLQELR
ncbi:hypothetical protein CCHL11_08029 [Colletotrichum chlorophyti]|uniref:MARVEL domain-containing protein n=1 Tax=Colletotrichum chlorophyti TaxID=708187 RepID=A0A1Q8RM48_9PEZI|nr:hypothetical protein CCHL11_08029 [Colletotrichum chlorophyti]